MKQYCASPTRRPDGDAPQGGSAAARRLPMLLPSISFARKGRRPGGGLQRLDSSMVGGMEVGAELPSRQVDSLMVVFPAGPRSQASMTMAHHALQMITEHIVGALSITMRTRPNRS